MENPVDVMCNCYGSHVLRSLLSLCKGVPFDFSELHATKSSTVLAERLNFQASQSKRDASSHEGFPDLLKFLVSGIFNCTKKGIKMLRVDQYSSLVFQACTNMPSSFCLFLLFNEIFSFD